MIDPIFCDEKPRLDTRRSPGQQRFTELQNVEQKFSGLHLAPHDTDWSVIASGKRILEMVARRGVNSGKYVQLSNFVTLANTLLLVTDLRRSAQRNAVAGLKFFQKY